MRNPPILKTCMTGTAVPVTAHAVHIGALMLASAMPGSVFGQLAQSFTQSAGMLPFDMHARTVVTIAFGAAATAGSIIFTKPDTPTTDVLIRATCAGSLSAGLTYATTGEAFGALQGLCGNILNIVLR